MASTRRLQETQASLKTPKWKGYVQMYTVAVNIAVKFERQPQARLGKDQQQEAGGQGVETDISNRSSQAWVGSGPVSRHP